MDKNHTTDERFQLFSAGLDSFMLWRAPLSEWLGAAQTTSDAVSAQERAKRVSNP